MKSGKKKNNSSRRSMTPRPVGKPHKTVAFLEKELRKKELALKQKVRELEIEAALERVRSRTMAMHRSDELKEVILVVMEQFQKLGIKVDLANFNFPSRSRDWTMWLGRPGHAYPEKIILPYFDHVLFNGPREAVKKGMDFFSDLLTKDEGMSAMAHFYKHTIIKNDRTIVERTRKAKGLARSIVLGKNIALTISNFDAVPYTEEQNSILKRFEKVFEQSYTRFLDLEKAEAQAREAQIEAALEHIRSRALGMQQSSELNIVVQALFAKLQELNLRFDGAGILIFPEGSMDIELWVLAPHNVSHTSVIKLPYVKDHFRSNEYMKDIWEAKRSGTGIVNKTYSRKAKDKHFEYVAAHNDYVQMPGKARENIFKANAYTATIICEKNSGLLVDNWSDQLLTDDEINVVRRASKVFEQAYTRFLDLQKAESQAREAQIEASLERVRSKTMAMHNSEDVGDTVATLFDELSKLGINTNRCGILVFNETTAEVWTARSHPEGKATLIIGVLDLGIHRMLTTVRQAWVRKESVYQYVLKGGDLVRYYQAINDSRYYPVQFNLDALPSKEFHTDFFFPEGALFAFTSEIIPNESSSILKRFAGVFGQTYRRYLDLQKAETQAREAQIEASLERVRSSMMAMHRSDGLPDVMKVVTQQFLHLGVRLDSAMFYPSQQSAGLDFWSASTEKPYPVLIAVPYLDNPMINGIRKAMKDESELSTICLTLKESQEWWRHIMEKSNVGPLFSPERRQFVLSSKELITSVAVRKNSTLATVNYSGLNFSEEENNILKRFAGVFEQAYTRFLDIQKAEAQARHAQIEVAMEKVRSRAMAMQVPDELLEVATLLRKEMGHLGVEELETSSIYVIDEGSDTTQCWFAIKDVRGENKKLVTDHMTLKLEETWVGRQMQKFYQSGDEKTSILMQGENRKEWINYCAGKSKELEGYYGGEIPERTYHLLKFSNGFMGAASPGEISAESWNLLQRATSVFSLAYTRFLDLQKAEAQTREAQIELALERVRARTMAMHRSDELAETASIVFKQLSELGVEPNRLYIFIVKDDTGEIEAWITQEDGTKVSRQFNINVHRSPVLTRMYDGWKAGSKSLALDVKGKELSDYIHFLSEEVKAPVTLGHTQTRRVQSIAYFSQGLIGMASSDPLQKEEMNLLERFAAVFNLTYTRFNDLKQAEAQAREARIQASLERVRAKAMAMHSSKDLTDSIGLFYNELLALGLHPRRVGVALTDRESRLARLTTMSTTEEGATSVVDGSLKMEGHWLLEEAFNHWLRQEEFHASLKGSEINDYYKVIRPQISYPDYPHDARQYGYYFMFPEGNVVAWTEDELAEDQLDIFRRFTSVISLTYKRHKDLSDAEARTQLAIREASLDRVRAEIASMRTADDLQRITPLIWRELTTLGVPFFRCGVMIIQDDQQYVDFYLSTPEGKPLAALHLRIKDRVITQNAMNYWRQQQVYIDHWDRAQFSEFAQSIMKEGQIHAMESYQGGEQPPESLTLLFSPFNQGMLYVGSASDLLPEQIQLVHALAEAFSTAYARYEDFTKLETAKQQVEKTLSDLRQAQQQLVQSEKMASLGELTAGIAHEIQNPLNFVNNFSDVSAELLEEMKSELAKGNAQDAIAIAEDVTQNLEKILHHGKRADGIVKSMLQHSRSSSGKKEPTDINALADEYLRLAFHGLRAKDKSFNAKFDTDLDPTVGEISIIPQDIGRVILNLINNAFYAVTEKQKLGIEGYQPTVTVSSKNLGGKVEIRVIDNGVGIPNKVADKIFQPFFTTKPTGQGTGLGLSLSYDIITKGHGGELKVVTLEREGTTFVITLPRS